MIVRAECGKCGHKWDFEMKPMETITCPNCKTVYDALIVDDPENNEGEEWEGEEWECEMKNRISMALKDPTLQQGFEVICKNLVDLEKENAEL